MIILAGLCSISYTLVFIIKSISQTEKTFYISFPLCYPLFSVAYSDAAPPPALFLWIPAFIFYCCVAYPANPASLQPWGRSSFPPAALLSVQSGGFSRLIYNDARVGQIFTLTVTMCAWVYPDCGEEGEAERENSRILVTEKQQTVRARKKGSWKAVSAGGRRGGGWAASLILHHKHQSTFFYKTGKTKGLKMCLRDTA